MTKKKDNQYGRGGESRKPAAVKITPGAPKPLKKPMTPLETRRECAFIHGDPQMNGWTYCGHETVEQSSYCEFHLNVCLNPQTRQARK